VIKKVAEFNSGHPAFVSSNTTLVERYVVVHGQIILQQFADFPDESIRRSAFVTGLVLKMEERRHTKLVMKKNSQSMRGENQNPSAKMGPILKRKLMRATTTRFISKIWGDYYAAHFPEDTKEDGNQQKEIDEEQEENEDDDAEEVNVETEQPLRSPPSARLRKSPSKTCKEVDWKGQTAGKTVYGEVLYKCATVQGLTIGVGQSVTLEDDSGEAIICFTEYMCEKHDGTKMVHGRILKKGFQTVLGNAANEREVFLTNDCLEFEVGDIKELVTVNVQPMPWGHKYRKENSEVNRIERAKAEERKRKGLPVEYFCKSLYWPEKGGFFSVPHDKLGIGTGSCSSCDQRKQVGDEFKILSETSFVFKNIRYNVNDYLYIRPEFFSQGHGSETYKAGRNVGLKPYVVCHVLSIHAPSGSNKAHIESTKVNVRRFYRPDDISSTKAYTSDIREVRFFKIM
jgi:DNA (cytosine-5)-methyltransferase 1